MEDVAKRPYLIRRGDTYYYRRKIPVDLIGKLGREFKQSLGATSAKEAELAWAKANLEYEHTVRRARVGFERYVKPVSAPEGVSLRPLADLQSDAALPLVLDWFVREQLAQIAAPSEDPEAVEAVEADIAYFSDRRPEHYAASLQRSADQLLVDAGYEPGPDHPIYKSVAELVRRALIAGLEYRQGLMAGNPAPPISDPIFRAAAADLVNVSTIRSRHQARTFARLGADYIHERKSSAAGEKRRAEEEAAIGLLCELFGAHKIVREITFEDCRHVKEQIAQLPPNYTKRFKGVSAVDAIRRADADNLPRISRKTANKYLALLMALMRQAKRLRWIDDNPAADLEVFPIKGSDGPRRDTYSVAELNKIFEAPLYRGCRDAAHNFSKPGKHVPIYSGRYWVPLISLFSGMRENECCQLLVDDVALRDGVDVFLLNTENADPEKSFKTEHSKRCVPIHPELIRLGIVKVAAHQRSRGEKRLFPDLKKGSSPGAHHSTVFGKWFNGRFLTSLGIKRPGLVFHSFRHTFRDALRNNDVLKEYADALGGWKRSSDRSEGDGYGKGYAPAVLLREISKVTYPGLMLPAPLPDTQNS